MEQVYRFIPCPANEPVKLRQWLEDMANEGLLLEDIKFRARFRKAAPQALRYHLEPIQAWGFGGSAAEEPQPELMELARDLGWQFVCRYGVYHIYRTADPDARDFHTEAETQALALDFMRKRQRNSNIFSGLYYLFVILVVGAAPVLNMIRMGTVLISVLALSMVSTVWMGVHRFLRFRRAQNAIRAGTYSEDTDWRKGRRSYLAQQAVVWLSVLALAAGIVNYQMRRLGYGKCDLDEFQGDAPFVTTRELVEARGMTAEQTFGSVQVWSEPIASVNYDWTEIVYITTSDGTERSCSLFVDFHETASPWVARLLAEDYLRSAQFSALVNSRREYVSLDAFDLDVDFIACYDTRDIGTYVVIQQGNVVVHACISAPAELVTLEDWAIAMTELLGR